MPEDIVKESEGPVRQRVASGSPFEPLFGFCRAMRVGDRVLLAGTAPIWPDGSCDPDPGVQAARCFEIIVTALRELGGEPRHVVRTRMFITDAADNEAVGRAHGAVFADARPVATMVVVAGLLDPRWKVEIEAEAILD
jgi:enamine deaminase RidA (YjgF/YER057c/UK114 family)